MKTFGKTLALATVVFSLPLFAGAQNTQGSAITPSAAMNAPGKLEAASMVPVNALLSRSLDAKKDRPGSSVQAELTQKARLSDGTELPSGSILTGQVVQDNMQQQGKSTLALRFDRARLKDGKVIPIRAMIVGIFQPLNDPNDPSQDYTTPNEWTDHTLRVDEPGVVPGVDLHSDVASQNSGVFVSTKKDDVKLAQGSEVQFAVAPKAA